MSKINPGIIRNICTIAISLAVGGAAASDNRGSLPPKIFLAGEAAYQEFSKSIVGQADGSSELSIYFSDIENYQITMHGEKDSYVVTFLPKPYKGQLLRGGGAQYKIAKADLHVIDVVRYK